MEHYSGDVRLSRKTLVDAGFMFALHFRPMTLTDFDECRTVAETNQLFKALFLKMKAEHDNSVADRLREGHRKAMESIIYELRATAEPVIKRERSDSDLHGPTVRNWAVRAGLVLPKGRINKTIKDAYRSAHSDTPQDSAEPKDAPIPREMPTAAQVRSWARLEGIQCGDRGRIHPDLMTQYIEAHS